MALIRSTIAENACDLIVFGGPNGRLARHIALSLARSTVEQTEIVLLNVAQPDIAPASAEAYAETAFRRTRHGLNYAGLVQRILTADSPLNGILTAAIDCDLIVIGATQGSLFRNLLLGSVAPRVADQALCPVIIAKRRSQTLAAALRETVLPSIHPSAD